MTRDDYCFKHPKICKSLRFASVSLPLFVLVLGSIVSWHADFSERVATGYLIHFGSSYLLGRFMYRRATNQEAHFFATVVLPDDDDTKKEPCDYVALAAAAIFFMLAVYFAFA